MVVGRRMGDYLVTSAGASDGEDVGVIRTHVGTERDGFGREAWLDGSGSMVSGR